MVVAAALILDGSLLLGQGLPVLQPDSAGELRLHACACQNPITNAHARARKGGIQVKAVKLAAFHAEKGGAQVARDTR